MKRIIPFRFTILGNPAPKLRARVVQGPRGTRAYTPQSTAVAEAEVRWAAKEAGVSMLTGPVELSVRCFMAPPANLLVRKQRELVAELERPLVRPDWDNLGKLVSDALIGVAYLDDSQVVEAHVEKWYSWTPRTEIMVRAVVLARGSCGRAMKAITED